MVTGLRACLSQRAHLGCEPPLPAAKRASEPLPGVAVPGLTLPPPHPCPPSCSCNLGDIPLWPGCSCI